ncbi:MAG: hypothetical protein MZU79_02210 [Anaerotruncus sp.]|nr:hypothetical protein [Anaerotruncus sp.]
MIYPFQELKELIEEKKSKINECNSCCCKYEGQQMHVKNNREYVAISKEMELQKLEIMACDKKIKKFKGEIAEKEDQIASSKNELVEKKKELHEKQKRTGRYVLEKTEKEEARNSRSQG